MSSHFILVAISFMLISRFKFCSHDVKTKLFKSFLSNAYDSQLLTRYRNVNYRRIVVAYNNIYRALFGVARGVSMSAIYVQHNIYTISAIVRKNIYSFKQRLCESGYALLNSITYSLYFRYSHTVKHWNHELFITM